MNDRLLSARRVLDVQVKLRRIAELKLAELQRQEQVLAGRGSGTHPVSRRRKPVCGRAFVEHRAPSSEEQPEAT